MATTETEAASRTLIEEILAHRTEAPPAAELRVELERRTAAFEDRYGIASDRLGAAIDRGEIEETLDVCQWLKDDALRRRVAPARTARRSTRLDRPPGAPPGPSPIPR